MQIPTLNPTIQDGADGVLQTEPKLATRIDEDGRLPIHWAVSSNSVDIVVLLAQHNSFDPDVQVGQLSFRVLPFSSRNVHLLRKVGLKTNPKCRCTQDGSGWTPLMIAASLKDGEDLVNLLLQKGADVNLKSKIITSCIAQAVSSHSLTLACCRS